MSYQYSKFNLVPRYAEMSDAAWIADRLRDEDRAEIEASTGKDARSAVEISLSWSHTSILAAAGDDLVAVWGIGRPSMYSRDGWPWALTGYGIERHRWEFL